MARLDKGDVIEQNPSKTKNVRAAQTRQYHHILSLLTSSLNMNTSVLRSCPVDAIQGGGYCARCAPDMAFLFLSLTKLSMPEALMLANSGGKSRSGSPSMNVPTCETTRVQCTTNEHA